MAYTPNNPYIPGDPYSYDLKWIVDRLKSLNSSINSLNNIIDNITLENGYYNLLTFEGDTLEDKLENAINTIDHGVIRISDMTIDRPLVITKDCRYITIFGGVITLETSSAFTAVNAVNTDLARCPIFLGTTFVGNNNAIYDEQKNIGATFSDCVFVDTFIYNLNANYIQSCNCNNCTFGGTSAIVFNGAYDFVFTNNKCESSSSLVLKDYGTLNNPSITKALISGNLIEGRSATPINLASGYKITISDNYFEANAPHDINFDLSANRYINAEICGNLFIPPVNGVAINFSAQPSALRIVNIHDNTINRGYLVSNGFSQVLPIANTVIPAAGTTAISAGGNIAVTERKPADPVWNATTNTWDIAIPTAALNNVNYPLILMVWGNSAIRDAANDRGSAIFAIMRKYYGTASISIVPLASVDADGNATITATATLNESGLNQNAIVTIKIAGFRSAGVFDYSLINPLLLNPTNYKAFS